MALGVLSGVAAYLPVADPGTCWIRDGERVEYGSVNPDARVEVITTIVPAGFYCVYVRNDGQSTFVSPPDVTPTLGLLAGGAMLVYAVLARGDAKKAANLGS